MPGDAVDLVGERERVLLEPNPVARLGSQPLRVLALAHVGNGNSGVHRSQERPARAGYSVSADARGRRHAAGVVWPNA